jgi:hypothetical protein
MIISAIAKNSAPKRTNNPETLKNANIKKNTEYTGFLTDITATAEEIRSIENT